MAQTYDSMNDEELRLAHAEWCNRAAASPGWSSAKFASTQIEEITRIGNSRGLGMTNPYPIVRKP